MEELTDMQTTVLAAFDKREEDISISILYMRVYGLHEWRKTGTTTRAMQQRLGPHFKKLNAKIQGMEIVPGYFKNTYRLNITENGK